MVTKLLLWTSLVKMEKMGRNEKKNKQRNRLISPASPLHF